MRRYKLHKFKGIKSMVLTMVSWFVVVFFVNKTVSKEFYSVMTIETCTYTCRQNFKHNSDLNSMVY